MDKYCKIRVLETCTETWINKTKVLETSTETWINKIRVLETRTETKINEKWCRVQEQRAVFSSGSGLFKGFTVNLIWLQLMLLALVFYVRALKIFYKGCQNVPYLIPSKRILVKKN